MKHLLYHWHTSRIDMFVIETFAIETFFEGELIYEKASIYYPFDGSCRI
jgi:hypothetical protein